MQDKLQKNPYLIVIYKEHYLKEKSILDKMISLKEKIIAEQYDHYRFNYDKELRPNEITTYYLNKDKKILQINNLIRKQQWRVDFFDMCVDGLTKQSWAMKSFLESLKLT